MKIVRAELEELMGAANEDLALSVAPPAVILMAGLQGAGKTTTAGKLARFLKERKKKSVMVVSPTSTDPPLSSSWKPWRARSA